MMYLRYALYVPLNLTVLIFAYLTAPFWAWLSLFLKRSTLPGWLALLHTHDDDLDGGQHQLGWPPAHDFKRWWQRTRWIARNPGYGFSAKVLGFEGEGALIEGGMVNDWWNSDDCRVWYVWRAANGRRYFTYRRQVSFAGGKRYVKLWLGWSNTMNDGKHHMLKTAFNPFLTTGAK